MVRTGSLRAMPGIADLILAQEDSSERGDDTLGNPHRAQISQFELELKFTQFELFEFILLLKLDKQLPVEQFEASRATRGSSISVSSTLPDFGCGKKTIYSCNNEIYSCKHSIHSCNIQTYFVVKINIPLVVAAAAISGGRTSAVDEVVAMVVVGRHLAHVVPS